MKVSRDASTEETAWCAGHQLFLPAENFAKQGKKGRQKHCRACHREYMARWRAEKTAAAPPSFRSHKKRGIVVRVEGTEDPMAALARKYANR